MLNYGSYDVVSYSVIFYVETDNFMFIFCNTVTKSIKKLAILLNFLEETLIF